MHLNLNMKGKNGISKIALIIIALIAVIIIVAIISAILININKNEPPVEEQNKPQQSEILLDTSTEITLNEKNKLKEEYLGLFALLVSDQYETENEKLVEIASKLINKNSQTTIGTNITPSPTGTTNLNSNVISNEISFENNVLDPMNNTLNSASVTDTLGTTTNTIGSTINSGLYNENTTLNKDEVTEAINEIKGSSVENLTDLLSNWDDSKLINTGYVTNIVSMKKANGVYDITYKVCWPKQSDILEYSAFDKTNTALIDKLETTEIKIQLTKNMNYVYSEYKILSINEVSKEIPTAYYLTYNNNKYGVIDQTGNVILQPIYDWIDIPNNYKDIFICKSGIDTIVLNKLGEPQYTDYKNISVIESTAGGDTKWYEKDFLVYEKNGLYGAIDYDGFEIYEPIYQKIEPLYYIKGALILTNDIGSKTLGYTNGVTHNFKYTKVGLLGGQFTLESMVNSQRTLEQVQQMTQTEMCIVGEDVNGVTEFIKRIPAEKYNLDFSSEPQINYEPSIVQWQLRSLEGGSIGRYTGTYYYLYIQE